MSIVCAHPTNLNNAIKVGLKFDAQATGKTHVTSHQECARDPGHRECPRARRTEAMSL